MTTAIALDPQRPLLLALERELSGDPRTPYSPRGAHALPERIWSRALGAPLRDFLERPGKEFRGEVTRIFFGLASRRGTLPVDLPLVVEVLHAGSLIVDDVEDASEERRGRPALHRLHGVPVALNAGNWLYFWAFELLAGLELPAETTAAAQRLMSRALLDCHYGQSLDLSVRVGELAQGEVPGVVRATTELKTGSLVALSAGLGALVGGAQEDLVLAAFRFGRELGSALQMLDDLSGVVSPRRAHKGLEDLRDDRPTWVWAWLAASEPPAGYARLRRMAASVTSGEDAARLVSEIRSRLQADGRRQVRSHLEAAFERIAPELPPGTGLSALRRELERLERSYV